LAGDSLTDLTAPESGWPAWAEAEPEFQIAPRAESQALPGEQIFVLVSASVHRMDVQHAAGNAQGSAVAVSPHALLTNCHGLAGARRISIRSDGIDHPAVLAKANPASDRCVLEVPDLELKPVLGSRSFADLKIGEVAYSVGAAQGFEQTFGAGVISGLREIDGQPFIQTSAPISSGSSGGGLFDARGNLIGVTTFVRIAIKGVAQSLNFAIPAEQFLKP
jgi:S1-C subfamily serine protease